MRTNNFKNPYLFFLIFIAAIALIFVFASPSSASRSITFSTENQTRFPQGCEKFDVEVVSTQESRQLGLMFRKELPRCAGMLFVFGGDEVHQFWMKNTYLSLDMIFVDRDYRVVGIVENVPPLTTEARGVGKPSRFVVELAAGEAKRSGVSVGSQMKFDFELPPAE